MTLLKQLGHPLRALALVLVLFALRWVREPAFLGKNHDRESRH